MASSVPDRRPNCRYSMNQPIQRIPTTPPIDATSGQRVCTKRDRSMWWNSEWKNRKYGFASVHDTRMTYTADVRVRNAQGINAIVYFFRFSAFCILFSTASIVILIIETWIKIRLVFKKMHGSNLIDEKKQFVVDLFRFSKIFLLLERID